MNRSKLYSLLVALVLTFALVGAASAQQFDPQVTVNDQVVNGDTVLIESVNSAAEGWLVIHADNGEGSFGAVIGQAPLNPGENTNVTVEIDTAAATSTLYAMLHEDTGEIGEYEFGMVDGADGPVAVDGAVVTPTFTAEILDATDQFVDMNTVTIDAVTMSQDGFVVVHAGDAESFGAVIGFAPVSAGTTTDVTVELDGEATDVVWPMLHVDTGEAGTYEFGQVEGADGPVAVNGTVATLPIWTVPNMRASAQPSLSSDGMMMDDMAATFTVDSVLSDGPGFVVVHAAAEAEGGGFTFGRVIGFTAVEDGFTEDVVVELTEAPTPIVFPMLHVDTGEVGTYEFGTVEGADGPVVVNGEVETFQVAAAPSIVYDGTIAGDVITVEQVVSDAPGWLVIHAAGENGPGAVIGQTQIGTGVNNNVAVTVDEMALTETVFPMLHYDTGVAGEYEFGSVEGADGPVAVNGNVVTAPMVPTAAE